VSASRLRMRFGRTQEAVPAPPLPRDRRGWRVAPAPDGRGMPEGEKPRPPHRVPVFWLLAVALLAINRAAAAQALYRQGEVHRLRGEYAAAVEA
jgi:hypothetical protein